MKSLLTLILTASLAHSATIISSTVTQTGNTFRYEYRASAKVSKHDISNITIPVCDAFDEFGDDCFKLERKTTTLKFDSIKPEGEEFVFGFSSYFAPVTGLIAIKAGRETHYAPAHHPASCVPEPSSFLLSALFFTLPLTCLRRR